MVLTFHPALLCVGREIAKLCSVWSPILGHFGVDDVQLSWQNAEKNVLQTAMRHNLNLTLVGVEGW